MMRAAKRRKGAPCITALPEEVISLIFGCGLLDGQNVADLRRDPRRVCTQWRGCCAEIRCLRFDTNAAITRLPKWVEQLINLQILRLEMCTNLTALPERFERLESLRSLNLGDCRSLTELPKGFKQLKSLTSLNLEWCTSLKSLPEGFEQLDLKKLDLYGCRTLTMDEEINKVVKMKNLEELDVGNTNIKSLPEGFEQLKNLKELNLWNCWNISNDEKRFDGETKVFAIERTRTGVRIFPSLPEWFEQMGAH